ncbi:MAG: integrin alpha, partial [Planctomycetota bacterium]
MILTRQLCMVLVLLLTAGGCEKELVKSTEPAKGVVISNVSVPSTCVQGDTVPVVVTVENRGEHRETFEVTLTDTTYDKGVASRSVMLSATDKGQVDEVADLILTGENPGDKFGTYNFSGDINGDGYDDLLVAGASRYNNNQGRVYLYFGRPKMDGIPDLTITGKSPGDYFGEVGPMGDVNGDGYDDLVVGTPGYKDMQGQVYVYYGGSRMDHLADLILDGETVQNRFGRSIALGDINNDGC